MTTSGLLLKVFCLVYCLLSTIAVAWQTYRVEQLEQYNEITERVAVAKYDFIMKINRKYKDQLATKDEAIWTERIRSSKE